MSPDRVELLSVPCPRCGSSTTREVASGADYLHDGPGRFFVAECSGCSLWFQNPRPADADLGRFYPSDYAPHRTGAEAPPSFAPNTLEYLRRRMGYAHLAPQPRSWRSARVFDFWRERIAGLELVPHFVEGGRLLEIGCATGERLRTLRDLGWTQLRGIELSPRAAAVARAQSIDVDCAPADQGLAAFPDGHFDVVVASMVLEHLPDPFATLRAIASKLRGGGELLLSTVVRDAADAWAYGPYWSGFDFPRHTVFFRSSDLTRALAEHFRDATLTRDSAPADFERPARWRAGEGRRLDGLVRRAAAHPRAGLVAQALGVAGLGCRVAVRARRGTR